MSDSQLGVRDKNVKHVLPDSKSDSLAVRSDLKLFQSSFGLYLIWIKNRFSAGFKVKSV